MRAFVILIAFFLAACGGEVGPDMAKGSVSVGGSAAAASPVATLTGSGAVGSAVDAFILSGQSNMLGPNSGSVPGGIPTAQSIYWLRVPNDAATNDNALRTLNVRASDNTHGLELQFGLDLIAAGLDPFILKVARGNTFMSSWVPGQFNGDALLSELAGFKAAVAAARPGVAVRWHFLWFQGESEAKDSSDAAALAWGSNFDLLKAGLESTIGGGVTLAPHIIRTHTSLGSAPHVSIVRAQQASRASILQSVDGYAQSGDSTHFPAATYNNFGADAADLQLAALGL